MQVEIDEEALAEAVDARDYYALISAELAQDFLRRLDEAIVRIGRWPALWPQFTHRTRRYLMDRFPYAVVYRIKGDTVRVVAVMHQHRRPGYWSNRPR